MQIDYILEQGTGAINEDYYLIDDDLFGVFDGATSLTDTVYENGHTGGFLAAHIVGKSFSENNAPLRTLAQRANAGIAHAMVKKGVDVNQKENRWCTSAAVIRLHESTFEWIQTGDCLILAIFEDGTHEVLIRGFDHDYETLRLWQEISQKSDETLLSALKNQIKKVRSQMNITYGVLNGELKAMTFLNQGEKSLHGIKHILLFTDGLFVPQKNPKDKENFELFVSLFCQGGLSNIKKYIRNVEKTDRECRIYPRFKTHDDIAAISLTF